MAEKNTSRVHFNLLDAVIVLAIIAVLAGVTLRYNLVDKLGIQSSRDSAEISFLISEISETSVDALVQGDVFYDGKNGAKLGELVSKTSSFAEAFVENADGYLIKAYNEAYYDVRGKILAVGKMTDDGFMLNGTNFLSAGKTLQVYSKNSKVTILITDISAVE